MRTAPLALLVVAPAAAAAPAVTVGGEVEAYYGLNVALPSNGVTNLRAFDDRAETFALQNAVLDATWKDGPASGRVALQFGDAGDLYYQAEPAIPPTGSAPAGGPSAFRHVQEAYAAWAAPASLQVAAGLFLSPIGPESVEETTTWSWSRSDLFFALPFYHLGVRVTRPLGDSGWSATAAVYNGWNDVLDNNQTPSIDAIAAYGKGAWTAQLQYFGGIERPTGAPEGQPWRNLFDAYVQGPLACGVRWQVHADAGFERTAQGTAAWYAGAGYLRWDLAARWYLAGRADYFREIVPAGASPLFFPVAWVASGTATASYKPADGFEVRLEVRHDHAASDAYFGGTVSTDPVTGAAIPNRRSQDTLTLGALASF